jgi:hypothetical protein
MEDVNHEAADSAKDTALKLDNGAILATLVDQVIKFGRPRAVDADIGEIVSDRIERAWLR